MKRKIFVTAVVIIVGFALFSGVVWLMYVWSGKFKSPEEKRAQERMEFLREARVTAEKELNEPAWIDREQGVVRIPIDRAMKLTVEELKNKKVEQKGKTEPVPSNVVPPPEPK